MQGHTKHTPLEIIPIYLFIGILAYLQHNSPDQINVTDGDILVYYANFLAAKNFPFREYIDSFEHEKFFLIFNWLCANLGVPFLAMLAVIRCFIALSFLHLSLSVSRRRIFATLSAVALILSPIFESYSSIIIRQGFSLGFFLLFFRAILFNEWLKASICGITATMIHSSNIMFIPLALVAMFSNRALRRIFEIGAPLIVLIYLLDLPTEWISPLFGMGLSLESFETYGYYYTGEYTVGFKQNFLLVSIFHIIMCYIIIHHRSFKSSMLIPLAYFSIFTTSAYMLASGMAFYDRIAIVGWMFVPVIFFGLIDYYFLKPPFMRGLA